MSQYLNSLLTCLDTLFSKLVYAFILKHSNSNLFVPLLSRAAPRVWKRGGQSLQAKRAKKFFECTPHFSQCGGYKKLKSQNISKPKHNTIGAQPWFQSWEVGPARGGCRSLLQRGPWRARKHASSYKGVWGLWPPVGSRGLPLVGGVRGASPPEGDGISAWLYYTRDLNLTLLTYTCMKNKVLVSFISCARHTRP